MSKTKKIISLALTLLMVLNIFSVVALAEDDLADYSSLTDYIEKNVPIDNDAGIYSAESYAAVEDVLDSIDYELPASAQATVDGYLSDMKTAVGGLVADESKAVAEFALTGTSEPLHPEDTVTVTFSLNTNYRVISTSAVIIFDSTKFELLGGNTINNNVVHYSDGVFSSYTLTGSKTNTNKIFSSRNSNTEYWNTEAMKAQYTALNIGFALNSKVSDPVVADGTVATMTFKVLEDVEFGTQGSIFMSSDFNKTSSFAGGLNYAARSVGEKMGPVSSCIAVGQTIDLDDAQLTLTVAHTPVTEEAVAPTCTEPGTSVGQTYCSVCGEVISPAVVLPALGHTVVEDAAVAATCTEAGLTAGSHCSVCHEILVAQEVVPALGHQVVEDAAVAATCTQSGLTAGSHCGRCNTVLTAQEEVAALGHDYVAAVTEPTCTEGGYTTYSCSRCDSEYTADETEALGHVEAEWVIVTPATCTTEGLKTKTCSRCHEVYDSEVIEVIPHTWDDGEITTQPTCTEKGVKTYTCTVCDATYTEEVAALGHQVVEDAAVPATCTETGLTAGSHCGRCDIVLVAQEEVAALGHDVVEDAAVPATCTETGLTAGSHCDRCKEVLVAQEEVAALGHDWDEGTVTTDPTCTEKGVKTYECSRCDATYTEDVEALGHTVVEDAAVPATCTQSGLTAGSHCSVCHEILVAQEEVAALGHDWDEGTVTTDPTCTEKGVKTYECSRCDATYTEEVAALGHDYEAVVTDPTCTEGGYTTYSCSRCDSEYTADETEALGHDYVAAVTDPTCTEGGYTTYSCSRCDSEYTADETEALGHVEAEWVIVTPATCTEKGLKTKTCSRCDEVYESEEIAIVPHTWNDGEITTSPSCTQTGVKTYTCTVCDATYTEEVAALGHNVVEDAAVPATCTETGLTAGSHCGRCKEVLVAQEEVAALGHDVVEDAAVPATCTETGLTAGSHCDRCKEVLVAQEEVAALGHDWDEGTVTTDPTCTEKGVKTYECSRCDATYTEEVAALGHDYKAAVTEPTCTEGGYTTYSCSRCDSEYVADETEALGHDYKAVVTEPTCTEGGYTTYSCSRCDSVYTADETEALGHDWDEGTVTTDPTCTEKGVKTYECSRCDATYTEDVEALGHDYEAVVTEPTCTEGGYTTYSCSRCDSEYTADETEALGHDYKAVVTEPTCTEGGYTTYSCSRCDSVYTADETEALGHDWDEGTVTKDPTCTEKGVKTYECSRCDATYTEDVAALGHDYKAVVTDPKCTEGGYTTYSCSRCDSEYVADETEALGHVEAEWVIVTPATCTEKGLKTKTCSRCDEVYESEEIAIVPHTWNDGEITTSPSCTQAGVKTYTCTVCGATTTDAIEALGHTPGEQAVETIDNVEKYVVRCTVCGEIISAEAIGLADYTELNAAIATAQAIDPYSVYYNVRYNNLMAYIETVDMTLTAIHQDQVDEYTATINDYLTGLTILDQLKIVNATATISGTTITLTINSGATQINVYPNLVSGETITFSNLDGPLVSRGGTLYSKVNGTATIAISNGRQYTLAFVVKAAADDVADYSKVDIALTKAAAIKEADVYDEATYTALQTAVNAVVRGLHEKDQKTVTGYATAINNALKNIELVQDQIRVSSNTEIYKNGDTIVISLKENSEYNYLTIYNDLYNGTDVTFLRTGKITLVSDNQRYAVKQTTTAKILLENGKEYNILFIINDLEETGLDALNATVAKADALNAYDYYDFSAVTAALNEIRPDLDEEDDIDTINYYTVTLKEAINSLKTVVSLLWLQSSYAAQDGDTIVIRPNAPGTTVMCIYLSLTNGDPITLTDIDGLTLYKTGTKYYTKTGGTATMNLEDGRTFEIEFVTDFVHEFRSEFVKTYYIDGPISYDEDTTTLSATTSFSIARIYKDAVASTLSIDLDDYPFITETTTFYQINSSALQSSHHGVANFVMHSDDGTDVNIAITFTALLNKSVLDYVTFGNATSVTLDGNVITITLDRTVSSKSYVTIPKTTKTGETVVVSSPNTYVQNQNNSAANYILRYQAAGADITLTFDNRDYTVVYNVVS